MIVRRLVSALHSAAFVFLLAINGAFAQQPAMPAAGEKSQPAAPAAAAKKTQPELEADFAKMLSGATLEGSFNVTDAGRNSANLAPDKYTLGEVKKQIGNIWTIQYKFREQVVPLPIPIVSDSAEPLDSWHMFEQSGRLFVPKARTNN